MWHIDCFDRQVIRWLPPCHTFRQSHFAIRRPRGCMSLNCEIIQSFERTHMQCTRGASGMRNKTRQTCPSSLCTGSCRISCRQSRASDISAAAQSVQLQASEKGNELKQRLRKALVPIKSCGIFGVKAAELQEIQEIVATLERESPLEGPTGHLDQLAGEWKVIFSTIKVTGSRRVKLGLRDLVQIGQLTQEIDSQTSIATNRVAFNVPAFGVKNGELILKAAYNVSSPSRVTIKLEQATLVPERLQGVFKANFDLLLSIFNPAGFLDITYCDSNMRCGRDDKDNVFVLERTQ